MIVCPRREARRARALWLVSLCAWACTDPVVEGAASGSDILDGTTEGTSGGDGQTRTEDGSTGSSTGPEPEREASTSEADASSESSSTGEEPTPTPSTCTPSIQPVDTTTSKVHVVGDGDSQSCTEEALDEAMADSTAEAIVFDCGDGPTEIRVDTAKLVTRDLVIDGGGSIVLGGGNDTRILHLRPEGGTGGVSPRLTVQGLTFAEGRTSGIPQAENRSGAAILNEGGTLHVIDCRFVDNEGPDNGFDISGGAIHSSGSSHTVVVGSEFDANHNASGGAIGIAEGTLEIVATLFANNRATGNSGQGGLGGALAIRGDVEVSLCDVRIENNQARIGGGGLHQASNGGGIIAIDRTAVTGNVVLDGSQGRGGGLFLDGVNARIANSTVADNTANGSGGIRINGDPIASTLALTNVTIANNACNNENGAAIYAQAGVAGTLLHVTIAGNECQGNDTLAAAIFEGLALEVRNSIIAGNRGGADYASSNCNVTHAGASNLQWPDGELELPCTEDPNLADPRLGPLGDHGGPTPTILPGAGSPAIAAANDDCPPFDQRGEPRPVPCALGAVEPD